MFFRIRNMSPKSQKFHTIFPPLIRSLDIDAPFGHMHQNICRDILSKITFKQCLLKSLVDSINPLRKFPCPHS